MCGLIFIEAAAQAICRGKKDAPTNHSNEIPYKQLDNKNRVGLIIRISLSSTLGDFTMCYQVFLSTDTNEDLSVNDCDLVKFSKDFPFKLSEGTLKYENLWHVQSEAVCSCSFRHLSSTELGFGEPEDWYPEEDEFIEATEKFTQIIRAMLKRNIKVDCVDIWQDDTLKLNELPSMDVDLSTIKDTEFRFFENYYFKFKCT